MTTGLTVRGVSGVGEVASGADLAGLLLAHADLRDGDVLVVTSKVVSKAEGRVVNGDRAAHLASETERVVARRGGTTIVRTRLGLVMAAAGIDASNTVSGTVVLLPRDPDRSALRLREGIGAGLGSSGGGTGGGFRRPGPNVAVIVSDTSGRAWRNGQTDIAIGAAGLEVLHDHAGLEDGYGNPLAVTAPAVADELAGAADVVTGKLSRCPAAVVSGLDHLVLPRGQHGPGAAALVRPESGDLFGLGAREAVAAALTLRDAEGFGAPVTAPVLSEALRSLLGVAPGQDPGDEDDELAIPLPAVPDVDPPRRPDEVLRARAATLAHSLGWVLLDHGPAGTPLRFTRLDP
jgi:coenzyme F420-0:L-glutamate ligase/coenzyme F420-1:gamma-L-glutamate ligase